MTPVSPMPVGSSRVTGKYQITIPHSIRKVMHIPLGADVLFRVLNKEQIELTILPPPISAVRLKGCLRIDPEVKEQVNKDNLTAAMGEYVATRSMQHLQGKQK